jgi:hypothetical protein
VGFKFARGMGGGWVGGFKKVDDGLKPKVDNGLKPKGFMKKKSLG